MQPLHDAASNACALQRVAYFAGRASRGLGRSKGYVSVARRVRPDLLVLGAPPVAIDNGHLDNSTVYHAIIESKCPVLLVPPGVGRGEGTIDKAVYAWLKKVRCIDDQSPLQTSNSWRRMQAASQMLVMTVTDEIPLPSDAYKRNILRPKTNTLARKVCP